MSKNRAKVMDLAQSRTLSQVDVAVPLNGGMGKSFIAALLGGLLAWVLFNLWPVGLFVAAIGFPLLICAGLQDELSTQLVLTDDHRIELIHQKLISRHVEVSELSPHEIVTSTGPSIGLRQIIIAGKTYRVRPMYDGDLLHLSAVGA